MPNFLMTLLTGLFIAVVTSILTVWLALWRFHSEKWWERKVELYSRLMEALFDMHSYNRQWLEDFEEIATSEVNSDQQEKRKKHLDSLWARHQKAADEVQKIAVVGAFIVSDPVADDLMQLKKARVKVMQEYYRDEYGDHGDPVVAYEKELKAIEDCIARFRQHAKEDLGITRKLPSIMKTRGSTNLTAT
jgi:hypothetical protein